MGAFGTRTSQAVAAAILALFLALTGQIGYGVQETGAAGSRCAFIADEIDYWRCVAPPPRPCDW